MIISPRQGRYLLSILVAFVMVVGLLGRANALDALTRLDRVLLHHHPLRGVAYQQKSVPGAPALEPMLTATTVTKFAIDGDPQINVRSDLHPIDVDGDGRFEYLQHNGYRLIRVYTIDGIKLWEADNPVGRVHRQYNHRDTLAVVDIDGDGGQDVIHCWAVPDPKAPDGFAKHLMVRDGRTGRIVRDVVLAGQRAVRVADECHIAAFRVPGMAKPLVLVSFKAPATAGCAMNYVDTFSQTVAFDTDLNRLWSRTTCDAGHYAWPLDQNNDGLAEAIFVGKYKFAPNGTLLCTLAGWPKDHVDSMAIGDFDPAVPGFEVVAVGLTGTRAYRASDCAPTWSLPLSKLPNPQFVVAAALDPVNSGKVLAIRSKPEPTGPNRLWFVSPSGAVLRYHAGTEFTELPMQNAALDANPGTDELVGAFGDVMDRFGNLRLSRAWYWNQQTLSATEAALAPPYQWSSRPLVYDVDGDGRDEIVTWGRYAIVVGKVVP
ncbi:MAG: hypothetical protein U1E45_11770 [Geminicoccaceae bacterium]